MTNAPLILVVGMHRSGTSLLGSILQAIGVSTPGELIPGDENNPEGYFERRDVTDLQEQLRCKEQQVRLRAACHTLGDPCCSASATCVRMRVGLGCARAAPATT